MTTPPTSGRAGGAEELRSREEVVGGWRLRLTSYRFGGEFVCIVANVDPGANIARAGGASREEAEERALVQAERRLTRPSREPARPVTGWVLAALLLPAGSALAQPLLFASRPGDSEVVAIDLAAGTVAGSFAAGTLPAGAVLSADGNQLYVADADAGELRVFDTAGAPAGSVVVGAGAAGVALCPGGTRLGVALGGADALAVVGVAPLAVTAILPAGDQPLVVACGDGFLAAASYGDATLAVFDAATLLSVGTAPVGGFPAGVAIAGGRAWVTSLFDSTVTVVDLATATVATTLTVGSAPRGIAAASGRLFVGNVNDGTLTVIDATAAAVLGTVALPTAGPTDVLRDTTTGDVLVAHLGEAAVSVVNPLTLAVTRTVPAPAGLLALAGVGAGEGVGTVGIPALGPLGIGLLATALALFGLLAFRWRGAVAVVLLCAVASGSPARAQTTTFSDSTFANADWQVFDAPGPASHFEGQDSLDGNPAPSRRMSHFQGPGAETVRVVHRWLAASYDASTSGAIASISVSWDRRTCDGDPPVGEVLEAFVVFQGGVAYGTSDAAFSSPVWENTAQTALAATDLDDGAGGSPDFSAAGGAISFGYARTTVSGGGDFVTCHAIDNLEVTIAGSPAPQSQLGFTPRNYFPLDGDDVVVGVTRSGDLTAPASVEVLLDLTGTADDVTNTVSWPAGTGGEVTSTFTAAQLGGSGVAVRHLRLQNPSPGAVILAGRGTAMIYRADTGLAALWLLMVAALARWDAAGLALLAAAAIACAVRRRRRQLLVGAGGATRLPARGDAGSGRAGAGRIVLWLLAATPGLLASWSCQGTSAAEIKFRHAYFNERISADLHGLLPTEERVDLRYGVFRDGTRDPDGAGPRTKGLISEVFPQAAIADRGPGNLIQTPCLFSARSDELRLTWELVMFADRQASEFWRTLLFENHDQLGLCTLSSPVHRLWREDGSGLPTPEAFASKAMECRDEIGTLTTPEGGLAFTVTIPDNLDSSPRNRPAPCRDSDIHWVRLEAFGPASSNPDAACPLYQFQVGPTPPPSAYRCPRQNGRLPACALPACVVQPQEDVSYRVSVDPILSQPRAERWLSPNVLVVDGSRDMVRPMTDTGSGAFVWQTPATHLEVGESQTVSQWAENFSPTVRVGKVQIVSRDSLGGNERVETPENERLTIDIPRHAGTTPIDCTGQLGPEGFTFTIADCVMGSDEAAVLAELTPTYLIANLHTDPVVQDPITWRATVKLPEPGEEPARQVFVKFGLRTVSLPPALRVSALHDFGRLPDDEYRQGTVELENVGGEAITVTAVDLVPGYGYPQEFSFFVVGDPVPMPLPLEAKTGEDGTLSWRVGDLSEVPAFWVDSHEEGVTIGLGDPAAPPGQPQSYTLYGQDTRLRGSVLTRDDAAAVFEPPPGSDPRPLSIPVPTEQVPPFVLLPGERRQIVVEARPSGLGSKHALLRVLGTPASNPHQTLAVSSALAVDVVSGPLLNYAPYSLNVYRSATGSEPPYRFALLENAGHVDLTIHSIQLTGGDAARFAVSTDLGTLGPIVLRSGGATIMRLDYLPECDGSYGSGTSALDHQAAVLVTSNGGNATIPVGGASQGFCE